MPKKKPRTDLQPDSLKGWQEISAFLSQPVSVAQRWAHLSGMPVERKGRYVFASSATLRHWLEHESADEPIKIAGDNTELSSELKRGLSYIRQRNRRGKQ